MRMKPRDTNGMVFFSPQIKIQTLSRSWLKEIQVGCLGADLFVLFKTCYFCNILLHLFRQFCVDVGKRG